MCAGLARFWEGAGCQQEGEHRVDQVGYEVLPGEGARCRAGWSSGRVSWAHALSTYPRARLARATGRCCMCGPSRAALRARPPLVLMFVHRTSGMSPAKRGAEVAGHEPHYHLDCFGLDLPPHRLQVVEQRDPFGVELFHRGVHHGPHQVVPGPEAVANYTEDGIWTSPEATTRGSEGLTRGLRS